VILAAVNSSWRSMTLAVGLGLLGPVAGSMPAAHAQAPAQAGALRLQVGGRTAITVPNVARVAVGDPDVADIRVGQGGEVEITGRAPGSTQLLVWKQDGQRVNFQITVTR
jgi:pilus assembly protein CpaC